MHGYLEEGDAGAVTEAEEEEDDEGHGRPEVGGVFLHLGVRLLAHHHHDTIWGGGGARVGLQWWGWAVESPFMTRHRKPNVRAEEP